jgi:hypothetical protein
MFFLFIAIVQSLPCSLSNCTLFRADPSAAGTNLFLNSSAGLCSNAGGRLVTPVDLETLASAWSICNSSFLGVRQVSTAPCAARKDIDDASFDVGFMSFIWIDGTSRTNRPGFESTNGPFSWEPNLSFGNRSLGRKTPASCSLFDAGTLEGCAQMSCYSYSCSGFAHDRPCADDQTVATPARCVVCARPTATTTTTATTTSVATTTTKTAATTTTIQMPTTIAPLPTSTMMTAPQSSQSTSDSSTGDQILTLTLPPPGSQSSQSTSDSSTGDQILTLTLPPPGSLSTSAPSSSNTTVANSGSSSGSTVGVDEPTPFPTGAVVGAVVGAVACVALGLGVACAVRRRRKQGPPIPVDGELSMRGGDTATLQRTQEYSSARSLMSDSDQYQAAPVVSDVATRPVMNMYSTFSTNYSSGQFDAPD